MMKGISHLFVVKLRQGDNVVFLWTLQGYKKRDVASVN
jgi:hypothetical protein